VNIEIENMFALLENLYYMPNTVGKHKTIQHCSE